MSEMVERVARAVAKLTVGVDGYPIDAPVDGNYMPASIEIARAAIEAMREPEEELMAIIHGGCDHYHWHRHEYREAWRRAIDRAAGMPEDITMRDQAHERQRT